MNAAGLFVNGDQIAAHSEGCIVKGYVCHSYHAVNGQLLW